MNILLINHYAGSPTMGMEYRPYYLAQEWIKLGHNVTIIAANNSHIRQVNPEMHEDFIHEDIDNINYIWVKTPNYKGNGTSRVKNIFSFVFKLYRRAKSLSKTIKPDVVIASSTYTSDNYVARKIARLSKAKYIYEVHDLWPLSPMELGNMSKYHPFIMLMQHGENYAYKHSDTVISMLPCTQDHMKSHGLDLSKWEYVPNGINIDEWKVAQKLNTNTSNIINKIKSDYSTIVAYTGTLGLANALDHFIKASEDFKDVAFVLVGKGPEKDKLSELIKNNDYKNVFILDAISKLEIPDLLQNFDYLYIGLKRQPLFRFGISPNKLIDYMMAAKPIIQAIDAGNNVVEEAKCGIHVEPENPKAIADAIQKLNKMSEAELQKMGQNGKKFVLENHDYKVLAKRMIDVFLK